MVGCRCFILRPCEGGLRKTATVDYKIHSWECCPHRMQQYADVAPGVHHPCVVRIIIQQCHLMTNSQGGSVSQVSVSPSGVQKMRDVVLYCSKFLMFIWGLPIQTWGFASSIQVGLATCSTPFFSGVQYREGWIELGRSHPPYGL